MEHDELQRGVPPVSVRIVGMGELVAYLVSDADLIAIERGSPGTTMATIGNTLLSAAIGLLGSLLLSGPPHAVFSFCVFVILISVAALGGGALLILSHHFKKDQANIIRDIRARKKEPKPPTIVQTATLVEEVEDDQEKAQ